MKKNNYLFFILLVSLVSCFSKTDKIDFLFPKGFKGNCLIIYNCKDGVTPVQKNGRKQINVPSSRIIKLKEEIKYGEIDYRYFMVQDNENNIQLKVYQSFQIPILDSFYVGPGTAITHFVFDSTNKKTENQSAFIFFIHKLGETIPSNYSDT